MRPLGGNQAEAEVGFFFSFQKPNQAAQKDCSSIGQGYSQILKSSLARMGFIHTPKNMLRGLIMSKIESACVTC